MGCGLSSELVARGFASGLSRMRSAGSHLNADTWRDVLSF